MRIYSHLYPQTFFPVFHFFKTSKHVTKECSFFSLCPFLSPFISIWKHTLRDVDNSYLADLHCNMLWSSKVVCISMSRLHCVEQEWKTALCDSVMRNQRVRWQAEIDDFSKVWLISEKVLRMCTVLILKEHK